MVTIQSSECTQTQVHTGNSYTLSATIVGEQYEDYIITISASGYYKEEETVLVEDLDNDLRKSFIEWHSKKLSSKQPVKPYRNVNRKLIKIRSRLR